MRSNVRLSKQELRKKRNKVLILFLKPVTLCFVPSALASISALKFEAVKKRRLKTWGEGEIMNLSVETKVAIAVATSFVLLMVGAMAAQG